MSSPPFGSSLLFPLMAGGQPISETVADQAAEWLTVLMSGEATEAQRQQWQTWRRDHPDHERAWQHIEAIRARLKVLEPRAAYQVLSPHKTVRVASPNRRTVLSLLLWGGAAGTAAWLVPRTQPWQQLSATHRTAAGEQQNFMLDDGTQITLNTRTAIDVQFNGTHRLLRLITGEVLIETAHAENSNRDARPFIVETAEGGIRALGTRFSVRQHEDHTRVAVLESAVEITPAGATTQSRLLRADEQATFTRDEIGNPTIVNEQASAWARGQLVVDDTRLVDFLDDLSRYRTGVVRCDPAVADLRFSGVFPLHDTDRILATLPSVLPVKVRALTRYWVTVETAP